MICYHNMLYSKDNNKDELLTSKEMLPPQASRIIERKNFKYSCLIQILNKQVNKNREQREKQVKTVQD